MNLAILVMAAGLSRRFRQTGHGHKLTALLNGKPLLQHTLENARATGFDVFVMTRPEDTDVHTLLSPMSLLTCASEGLGHSIAAGVSAVPNYDGWLITLADMPFITPSSYIAVAEALRTSTLARTEVKGIYGHPVGFQRSLYPQLCALRGDSGARQLLNSASLTLVSVQDDGCITDIDTYDDMVRCQ